jgi:hypothetical protein
MKTLYLAVLALSLSAGQSALAAASTTCLCRSADNTAFQEKTHRHHRWACDFKLGYARRDGDDSRHPRPKTQTCNTEEIIQYKVWSCLERGCTYPYSKRLETKNPALEAIEPLDGKRAP